MKQFVLVYLGGTQPTDPDAQQAHFEKYTDWLKSLGESVVVPTIPLMETKTVGSDGGVQDGGSCAMSGFSIIQAESFDDALKVAQACPFLDIGGSLEVSELMQMQMQ